MGLGQLCARCLVRSRECVARIQYVVVRVEVCCSIERGGMDKQVGLIGAWGARREARRVLQEPCREW